MGTQEQKRPTDSELEILKVLWEEGPSTVRQVFNKISAAKETGYTTVLKIMQIMIDKGWVKRDTSVRPQVYRTAQPQSKVQNQLLKYMLDRAFSGSPGNLVLQALSSNKTSSEDRKKIRDLLNKLEEDLK